MSYQHSDPESLHITTTQEAEDARIASAAASRTFGRRRSWSFLAAACVMVYLLVAVRVAWQNSNQVPASSQLASMTTADQQPPPPPPEPDAQQGQFDWKKCQDSQDPNCWEEEGTRVHSYWKDFGGKWKSFWSRFHHKKAAEMEDEKNEDTSSHEEGEEPEVEEDKEEEPAAADDTATATAGNAQQETPVADEAALKKKKKHHRSTEPQT